ncbi:hypothetical protein KRP22_008620 [Phytophthora ramorum]|uniref:uncharacterized protein n=1 Tax=Phytophthora ramorum TaxID=164328 RepID=UPI0030AC33A4|nr:hypothetical protein KRP23_2683 [Phytophthora ramorum]KAH7501978.1 hypothetical protein KRP22_7452 [Phytophthora ramorum]
MPNGSSLTQIQQEMIKSAADALGLFHAQYIFTTGVFVGSSTAGTRVQKDVQFRGTVPATEEPMPVSHLLTQWKLEVDQLVEDREIDVVLGLGSHCVADYSRAE